MGQGNRFVGSLGERASAEFLKENGYRVAETNFRTPFGEIDMIARIGPLVVFVEVKTRLTSSLGPPYLSITRAKKRHIIKNALCYLKSRGLMDSPWRVDVVAVKLNYDYAVEKIELFENAIEDNC